MAAAKKTAAQRAAAEASPDPRVAVKWKDLTWHVLPRLQWDKSFERHARDLDYEDLVLALLDPSEHDQFRATRATFGETGEFANQCVTARGQDMGESEAS